MQQTLPYQLNNFQEDVLDQSHYIPVLVDYWASWCGPCKFLGPIVEKLAGEADGKWKLVMINTEDHDEIANEWGIKSIPNLKLFYRGKVIADLAGAMEEPEMREWITQKLPSEAKSLAMEATEFIAKGNTDKGIKLLENAIELDQNLAEARLMLAKLNVWNTPSRVLPLVEDIKHVQEAEELILLSDFLLMDLEELKNGNSRDLVFEANGLLKDQKIGAAIELLIQAVLANKRYHKELAKRLITAIFHIVGEGSEITRTYRRQFDEALY